MDAAAKTVLVVDDEQIVINFARIVLERAGYNVLTAASGMEALELCRRRSDPIHLLLTDIRMPRMNGLELAHCLAEHKPGVPVLFMTGFEQDSDVKRMFAAQPDMDGQSLLRKPFKSRELTDVVGGMLAQAADS